MIFEQNLNIALELKKKNIPIYILSNFPVINLIFLRQNYNFVQKFDDMIILGMKKPDPEIYKLCISKFKSNQIKHYL